MACMRLAPGLLRHNGYIERCIARFTYPLWRINPNVRRGSFLFEQSLSELSLSLQRFKVLLTHANLNHPFQNVNPGG